MYARYHIETTRWVLADEFSPRALKQIISANLSQDSVTHLFRPQQAHHHFCNNKINSSLAYIEEQHAQIETLAKQAATQVNAARGIARRQRQALGRLLHTAQDFYSHSNYVDLWLRERANRLADVGQAVDGLDEGLLNHDELRTAVWHTLEIGFHVPIIGSVMRQFWLPPQSHEAMHLDSPARGPRFSYSLIMAQQRTATEYRRALDAIKRFGTPDLLRAFHHER